MVLTLLGLRDLTLNTTETRTIRETLIRPADEMTRNHRNQGEGGNNMAASKNVRLKADFDEWFPQGLYLVGEIQPVSEYQSQEDRARNRAVRPRLDEVSGLPLYRGTFADPSAEKDREKSVTVEFAAKVQPVPPPAVPGVPFRPVVLEGMTVQPRAETSGQAKWITWVIRATGMTAPAIGSAASTSAGRGNGGSGPGVKAAA